MEQKKNHIEGVKYISLDVNHIKEIKNDFDLIYHLAGLSRIQHHLKNLHLLLFQIQKGWSQLLNGLDQTAQKLFIPGSYSFHHDPYQSPYAFYKYLGEEVCRMYRKVYDRNIEIVRFYNVYGPNELFTVNGQQ